MDFNFNNVKAAEEGRAMTAPGTIDAFTIEEVKYDTRNDKELFEVTFGRKADSFREYFYLTEKAAERFVYLYNKVMGTEQLPESEAGIITALTGKTIALKVIGSVNQNTGKGYPSLPYSGYARPVANMDELSFSNTEQNKIADALAAQRQSVAVTTGGDPKEAEDVKEILGGKDSF